MDVKNFCVSPCAFTVTFHCKNAIDVCEYIDKLDLGIICTCLTNDLSEWGEVSLIVAANSDGGAERIVRRILENLA